MLGATSPHAWVAMPDETRGAFSGQEMGQQILLDKRLLILLQLCG